MFHARLIHSSIVTFPSLECRSLPPCTNRATRALQEIARKRFSPVPILKRPAIVVTSPRPWRRQRGAGQGFSQPEPNYPSRWIAGSEMRFVLDRCLDLPLRGILLRDDDRERRFVELNKRLAIGSYANEQFTGNFRSSFRPAPDCL